MEPCSASSPEIQPLLAREIDEKKIDNKSEFNKQYNRLQNLK
jgi:hypothetical protein